MEQDLTEFIFDQTKELIEFPGITSADTIMDIEEVLNGLFLKSAFVIRKEQRKLLPMRIRRHFSFLHNREDKGLFQKIVGRDVCVLIGVEELYHKIVKWENVVQTVPEHELDYMLYLKIISVDLKNEHDELMFSDFRPEEFRFMQPRSIMENKMKFILIHIQ